MQLRRKLFSNRSKECDRLGDIFALSRKEKIQIFVLGGLLCSILAATFFQAAWGILFTTPLLLPYTGYAEGMIRERKKRQLEYQFKEAMQSVASSMQTGYSLSHAIEEAWKQTETLYGRDSASFKLFEGVVRGMRLNGSLDYLLEEMALQSTLDDVRNFTQMIKTARRYGGNLPDMLMKMIQVMEERMSVQEEIRSITTAIRYEAYIMDLIPAGIIWYLNLSSPEFLSVLYEGAAGRILMFICMVIYLVTVGWQLKIMERAAE